MIRHHLPDSLLAEHVAGTLPLALDVLVATHLALCPTCRAGTAALEEAAGALLDAAPPVPGDDAANLEALLLRLDEPAPAPTAAPPPRPDTPPDPLFPAPLRYWTGPSAQLSWSTTVPGVAQRVVLPLELEGIPVTLEQMRPGKKVPRHGHDAPEMTLLLDGGYDDGAGQYRRGDVQVVGPEREHSLAIDDDGPCILLSMRMGDRLPRELAAHVARWLGAL